MSFATHTPARRVELFGRAMTMYGGRYTGDTNPVSFRTEQLLMEALEALIAIPRPSGLPPEDFQLYTGWFVPAFTYTWRIAFDILPGVIDKSDSLAAFLPGVVPLVCCHAHTATIARALGEASASTVYEASIAELKEITAKTITEAVLLSQPLAGVPDAHESVCERLSLYFRNCFRYGPRTTPYYDVTEQALAHAVQTILASSEASKYIGKLLCVLTDAFRKGCDYSIGVKDDQTAPAPELLQEAMEIVRSYAHEISVITDKDELQRTMDAEITKEMEQMAALIEDPQELAYTVKRAATRGIEAVNQSLARLKAAVEDNVSDEELETVIDDVHTLLLLGSVTPKTVLKTMIIAIEALQPAGNPALLTFWGQLMYWLSRELLNLHE